MFILQVDEFFALWKDFFFPFSSFYLRFYDTHSDTEFINTLDEKDVCAAVVARIFEHVSEFSHE